MQSHIPRQQDMAANNRNPEIAEQIRHVPKWCFSPLPESACMPVLDDGKDFS